MLSLMQRNTALNELQHAVNPCVYDWGEPTPPNLPTHPDVILAADCIYFEPAFPLLLQTLQDLIVGAVKDAAQQVTLMAQSKLGPLAGGLGGLELPGL